MLLSLGLLVLSSALGQAPPKSVPSSSAPPAVAGAVAEAPKPPRLARTAIGTCGCALYAPPGMTFGEPVKSDDGSDVWTSEVTIDGYTYAAVVVRFVPAMTDGTPDAMEDLLVSYTGFLASNFEATSIGVGRGHSHLENTAARGVIDYWSYADGRQAAVKGWVDNERLAVLMITGPGEYPWFNLQQMYLDGFRFK